jgi:acetyl esterase
MSLAPQIQSFLDAAPRESLDFLTLPEERELMRHLSDLNYLRFGRRAEPVASVTDHAVPAGAGEILVRSYRPSTLVRLPAHIVLHGGGWWLGSIDEHVNEAMCRYRCVHAHCVVFAVEYRLAPEHPFPTAIEDCYSALCWIRDHADDLGIDADTISIAGTSAGANLAAAVTLRARDAGPLVVFQLLEVPVLDLTGESLRTALETPELQPMAGQLAELEAGVRRYLTDPAQALDPLASPLRAGDLSRLPPAHVMTAEFDPLRDEGERYARRLAEAGVAAAATRHRGAIHAASFLTRVWAPARAWQDQAATVIRRAHQDAAGGARASVGHGREGWR